jgi:hypothetical protein
MTMMKVPPGVVQKLSQYCLLENLCGELYVAIIIVTEFSISVKVNGKSTGRNQALVSLARKVKHHALTQSRKKVQLQSFFGITCWRVVIHTSQPLYVWAQSPWHPLDNMLCGPQS